MPKVLSGLRQPAAYLPQLESLRGWAILLVVLFHYVGILNMDGGLGPSERQPAWLQVLGAGNTGVTLFFVLSGFLLVQPFILALRNGEQVNITRFYMARLLRVVPLYYLVILVAWLATANASAFKALLFIPIGFDAFPFSVPWWSLCTEVQFYMLLPWIMLGLGHRLGRWLVLVGGLCWLGLHAYLFLQPQWLGDHRNASLQASLFGRGPAFLIGGLCSWLYLSRGFTWLTDSPRRVASLAVLLLVTLLWLLRWYGMSGQTPALMAMPFYHSVEALLWGGLLLCSLGTAGRMKALFINPLFSHLGTISYSLYLVHLPVQFYLLHPLLKQTNGSPWTPHMLAAITASFLAAWGLSLLCYRLIERPFLRLKAHLPTMRGRSDYQPVCR